MLPAQEEVLDLVQNPLPQIVIVEPLTRVWNIDQEIEALQKQIDTLTEQRQEALDYALDNAIEEDAACRLVAEKHVSTPNRKIDSAKIKTDLPKVYARIWELKRSEAKAEYEKFGEKVEDNKAKIALSQEIVGSAMKAEGHKLEEVLIPGGISTISYTYRVVPK
ncbi:MAG: hypothetical protein PHF64_00915 [Methanoregula sp.]|jgi:hypothetical protein|nr:hypothetical protein [Methanoregula sp.]